MLFLFYRNNIALFLLPYLKHFIGTFVLSTDKNDCLTALKQTGKHFSNKLQAAF